MAVTDPIADMLARLRNAHHAFHKKVLVPYSGVKEAMAGILKGQGYIEDCVRQEQNLEITLKYNKGKALIAGTRRKSTPGRRMYVGAGEIPRVQNGLGICILSTPQGILEGGEAKSRNVGGELLCEVW